MAIADIRSDFWRRVVLVLFAPVLLPIEAVVFAFIAMWFDVRTWPRLVLNIWREARR